MRILRIGRLGELLELQSGDINWRGSYVEVRRAFVGGGVTTPKNHQRRRVDLSRQLRAELRLWRRRERAAWLKRGRSAPPWVFASVSGTRLDPSNVPKAFDRMPTVAEVSSVPWPPYALRWLSMNFFTFEENSTAAVQVLMLRA